MRSNSYYLEDIIKKAMDIGLSFDSVVSFTLAHKSKPHSTNSILHDMLLTSSVYAISFLK